MIIYLFWIALGVGLVLAIGLVTTIASLLGLLLWTSLAAAWRRLNVRGRR